MRFPSPGSLPTLCVLFASSLACGEVGPGAAPGHDGGTGEVRPGTECRAPDECASGVCLLVGGDRRVCAAECLDTDCPRGWSCEPFAERPAVCVCSASEEECDGDDDDCDGAIDERCDEGACVCREGMEQTERRSCGEGMTEPWRRGCDGCRWTDWEPAGECERVSCGPRERLCEGRCASCPGGGAATGCEADRCVVTACAEGAVRCGSGCCTFTPEIVARGGRFAQLAVDSEGRPHALHYALMLEGGALHYARRGEDGRWQDVVIDADRQPGAFTSLALDAEDRGHAAYVYLDLDADAFGLRYARQQAPGGAWTIEPLAEGVLANATAIDLLGGAPRVAFHDFDVPQTGYASRGAGGWTVTTLAAPSGGSTDLVIDGAGRPHLAYRDEPAGSLGHAWFDAGWRYETVDTGAGEGAALAALPDGRVAVVYLADEPAALRLATQDGSGGWSFVELAAGGPFGAHPALAADAAGTLHAAYRDESRDAVVYLRLPTEGPAESLLVDDASAPGRWIDLALDPEGRPWVAYSTAVDGDLRVARPTPATPTE